MKLKKGCCYRVLKTTIKFGDLEVNEKLIYLGCISDWIIIDRFPEYLERRTYHFYNPETGKESHWVIDGDENFQRKILKEFLKVEKGGWPRPMLNEIAPIPIDFFDISRGVDVLQDHINYFKSVLEGRADVENFYNWFARHENMLSKVISGKEKLLFSIKPFETLKMFLEKFSISYKENPCYRWMDHLARFE